MALERLALRKWALSPLFRLEELRLAVRLKDAERLAVTIDELSGTTSDTE